MGGWCKEWYNKDENSKLEGLHQKPDQMEETCWEGQNFSEVVAPQGEEEDIMGNRGYSYSLFVLSTNPHCPKINFYFQLQTLTENICIGQIMVIFLVV